MVELLHGVGSEPGPNATIVASGHARSTTAQRSAQ